MMLLMPGCPAQHATVCLKILEVKTKNNCDLPLVNSTKTVPGVLPSGQLPPEQFELCRFIVIKVTGNNLRYYNLRYFQLDRK